MHSDLANLLPFFTLIFASWLWSPFRYDEKHSIRSSVSQILSGKWQSAQKCVPPVFDGKLENSQNLALNTRMRATFDVQPQKWTYNKSMHAVGCTKDFISLWEIALIAFIRSMRDLLIGIRFTILTKRYADPIDFKKVTYFRGIYAFWCRFSDCQNFARANRKFPEK